MYLISTSKLKINEGIRKSSRVLENKLRHISPNVSTENQSDVKVHLLTF